MDYQLSLLFCLSCLCLYILNYFCFSSKGQSSKLPPGPNPWPVVGNIFQLSKSPHLSLTRLSQTYGPLMSLELGSVTTIVVSSVDIAREVFQKHDLAFSSRRLVEASRSLDHHKYSMVWLAVSPKWRNLRKISSIHLFTKKQLDATEHLRHNKLEELLEHVGKSVDIGEAAFSTSLNLLSTTFFSTDLVGHSSASSHDFKDVVWALMEASGKPNLADFFLVLAYFDLLGLRRYTEFYMNKFCTIFDEIIEQRLSADPSDKDDVLATLLRISKEDGSDLSLDDIKHLLLDLFVAGTDTTSSTFEWAMTDLLRNPIKMEKG